MTSRTLKAFPALELKLAALCSAAFVRMETEEQQLEHHVRRITEMQAKVETLKEDNETIMAVADGEGRDVTTDERKQIRDNQDEIRALLDDIEDRQEHVQMLRDQIEPGPRLSEAEPSEDEAEEDADSGAERRQSRQAPERRAGRGQPGRQAGRPTRVETPRDNRELLGFKSAAHFLDDVKQASLGHRTATLNTALSQMGRRMDANASFGEDGAFPIVPDVANDIKKKIDASADLVGLCSRWNTNSDRYVWFLDEDAPWDNSAGITGEWLDEGETIGESQPRISKITTDLYKYAVAVPATHEILRNPSQLEQLIRVSTPMKIAEALNGVILDGNGVGKPLGIFQSGLAATQAKVSGQTAATVVRQNVTGMYNLVHPVCRTSANFRFVANLDVEPQLEEMVGADNRPLYLPGNSLAGRPHEELRGRPIIYSPHAKTLGQPGDLAGIDFSKYLVVFGENLRADFSIHVRFLQDRGIFRFIFHVGGRPMWGKKITEPNSATQRSFASVIAQRA